MINKFKQFENKNEEFYIIIERERGNIEGVQIYDDRESAYNFIRNFIHENISSFIPESYDDIKDEFDPQILLDYFNGRNSPNYEMYLYKESLLSRMKLDKHLELRMNSNKYNL